MFDMETPCQRELKQKMLKMSISKAGLVLRAIELFNMFVLFIAPLRNCQVRVSINSSIYTGRQINEQRFQAALGRIQDTSFKYLE